jgi:hypothetical protein
MANFVMFGVALLTVTEAPATMNFPIASTLFDPTTNSTTVIQATVPVQLVDTVKEFKFALVISVAFCICLIVFKGASINPFNSLLGIVAKKTRDVRGYNEETISCCGKAFWFDVLEAMGSWVFQLGGCVLAVVMVYALNGGDVPYTLPGDGTSVAAASILEGIFMWLMFSVSLVLHVLYDSDVCLSGRGICTYNSQSSFQDVSHAIIMAATLFISVTATAKYTGASLHWFRTLAACIVGGEFDASLWYYLLAHSAAFGVACFFALFILGKYIKFLDEKEHTSRKGDKYKPGDQVLGSVETQN